MIRARSLSLAAVATAAALALAGCGGKAAPAAPPSNTAPPGTAIEPPRDGCMAVTWTDDQAAEATYVGKLWRSESELPNGTKEQPLVMTLVQPACLAPSADAKETAEIQVYSPEPAVQKQLEAFLDKHVVVTGDGFAAQTAHHHRPLVVVVKRIAVK